MFGTGGGKGGLDVVIVDGTYQVFFVSFGICGGIMFEASIGCVTWDCNGVGIVLLTT